MPNSSFGINLHPVVPPPAPEPATSVISVDALVVPLPARALGQRRLTVSHCAVGDDRQVLIRPKVQELCRWRRESVVMRLAKMLKVGGRNASAPR